MTKLAERPRRRGHARRERASGMLTAEARARVIADLRACGVDIARAPGEALADFIESRRRASPMDHPALRPPGGGIRCATGSMRGCWGGSSPRYACRRSEMQPAERACTRFA